MQRFKSFPYAQLISVSFKGQPRALLSLSGQSGDVLFPEALSLFKWVLEASPASFSIAGATLPFWPAVLLVLTAKFVSAAGVYAVAR
jgi:hypothetical protein